MGNDSGLACPHCGASDQIDIAAIIWTRLTPDGADVTTSHDGAQEWDDSSAAKCCTCGHVARVADFREG